VGKVFVALLLACASALSSGSALAAGSSAAAAEAARSAAVLTGFVNVNAASAEQLQLLPGVGEKKARAIIALRRERGGFKSVDELTLVKGIGEGMLARLRPHLRTDGKTTAVAR